MASDLLIEIRSQTTKGHDALLHVDVDALEHIVHEPAEQIGVFQWEAKHERDHVDRNVLCVLNGGIDHIGIAHVGQQAPTQLANVFLERLDHLWRKRWQQQTTCLVMKRGVA